MKRPTTIQVKRIASFLKASCEKIPNNFDVPKLGQWLDLLSQELGFKDWNVTSASLEKSPVLTKELMLFPNAHRTFWGIARVSVAGEKATYHLSYSVNRELTRESIAKELAEKIRRRTAPQKLNSSMRYSRPDVRRGDATIAPDFLNREQGCPIVIKSDEQELTIHLWWLNEDYHAPDSIPAWAKGTTPHPVRFNEAGDVPLHEYAEIEHNDSLTTMFLKALTGREPSRRTCLYFPRWYASQEVPLPILVEEGNPNGRPANFPSTSDWSKRRSAVDAYNAQQGLSSLDCEAISARYEAAEQVRNEDDYVDFAGNYDD